ncbi:uncharacterized protein EDB91DRAFT_1252355 [Suillus paluster]|uniref:uncharacterized protein n=1 Tax=Suillus paluster TaxID=48578 RepID=UPI001B86B3F6|nr:uncharacterized protein EDB91DRAFT_1252355 [Suillus paluster]KAG1731104.1 hypothetical protein EDB91DRAFT_1252355 [Suillus paluster]
MQKFHNLYQGAFMVQTFCANFTAINGAHKVHELDKPGDSLNPAGGLVLLCAVVKQALMLVASHTITITMVLTAKGKSIPLLKTLNHSTAKVSNQQTGFNDITWGSSTHSYVKSIEFSKKSHHSGNDRAINDGVVNDEDLDKHAQLMDILESESGSEDHSNGSDVDLEVE